LPPVVRVAVAVPVASVVPFTTCTAPELAEKVTGTPDKALLAASRARAEMVAVVDPSDRMYDVLLVTTSVLTVVVDAEELATTCTWAVAVKVPAVAVTVMVLTVESPAVDNVALAAPVASVVACVTARPPEVAENATVTPGIRLLVASRARTVMVAVVEPSERMDVALVIAVSDVRVVEVVVPTVTEVFPDTVPAAAVTVIDVALATPEAVSVVEACPLELVVPVLAERVPALVENVTVAPETAVPLELVTTAVMVAPVEPFPGTVADVELTATVAGVPVVVPVPVPHEPVPVLAVPVRLLQPLSPPHPARASSVKPNRTIIEVNLRMFPT
jgi:hypothetical protein